MSRGLKSPSFEEGLRGFIIYLQRLMKKIIFSIVALCYFVVTCGVVVNYHYCMKKLASTSFFNATAKKECGVCGMEMHGENNCCHDEVQIVKMTDDQNKTLIASYTIPALHPAIVEPSQIYCCTF